jgi:hypothetical protein
VEIQELYVAAGVLNGGKSVLPCYVDDPDEFIKQNPSTVMCIQAKL